MNNFFVFLVFEETFDPVEFLVVVQLFYLDAEIKSVILSAVTEHIAFSIAVNSSH